MTSPSLNDHFNDAYEQFSMRADELIIPTHFDRFIPDNTDDYQCLLVISPSLQKGVKRWTLNGRYITIGVYRDEGRESAQRPPKIGISWTRVGQIVTITDPAKHHLRVGDHINIWNVSTWDKNNVNLTNVLVVSVIDDYSFVFHEEAATLEYQSMMNAIAVFNSQNSPIPNTVFGMFAQETGDISGSELSYQENFITDFYRDRRVFRLLPSFKLVTVDTIKQIFSDTAPVQQASRRTLYNVTTLSSVYVPDVKSESKNYELPSQSLPKDENLTLDRRFDQVYDESGQPLSIKYDAIGNPISINNVDSRYKNDQIFRNYPVELMGDSRVYVYDYYGYDLNATQREPYLSDNNISRDVTVTGNLNNFSSQIESLYKSTYNDMYGNLGIGIQENNVLVIRKQILPLSLDTFNRPTKSSILESIKL